MTTDLTHIDPLIPFEEKKKKEFGIKVAKMIASQWFNGGVIKPSSNCEYNTRRSYIIDKREFVRNEVDVTHLKKRISKTKTDLNLYNLNFKTKNIGKKFCSTVINSIGDENYILDIHPTDHITAKLKKDKEFDYRKKMASLSMLKDAKELLNIDFLSDSEIPEDEDEMKMWLEIKDRPKIKIAEEILIKYIKETNDWDVIEYQLRKDLVEIGIGVARVYVDKADGVKLAYVNPENYVHSYNENTPNFKNKFYEGVVEEITISDLIRESGSSEEDIKSIVSNYGLYRTEETFALKEFLNHKVQVLRFAYKTHKRMIFKQKKRNGEVVKIAKKNEYFNPPYTEDVGVLERVFDTWFEGNYVIGSDFIYGWQECENMYDDIMNKAMSPYITFATDIYKNRLKSFVDEIQEISDELNFIALKMQHLTSELKPDLTVLNEDALAEIQISNNIVQGRWEAAIDLLTTRGIVVESTVDAGADGTEQRLQAARVQGVQQGSAISILLNQWAFWYNQLRENTGINPAADGALRGDALVGLAQMMQLSSNMVTKNIADTAMNMHLKICETISTRINSIYKYKEASHIREIYNNVVGKTLMDYVELMKNRHLHEFGFIFRMMPTREDIQRFREDLSIALNTGIITVDIKSEAEYIYKTNPELARQFLNYSIRKEQKRKAQEQMALSKNKSENDAMAAQAKAQADAKAYQFKMQVELDVYAKKKMIDLDYEQGKQEILEPIEEINFQRDVYLERIKAHSKIEMEDFKENRKDDRTKIQASQQSKIVDQRQKGYGPIEFDDEYSIESMINYNNTQL